MRFDLNAAPFVSALLAIVGLTAGGSVSTDASAQNITTTAGGWLGDGGLAKDASLNIIGATAVDAAGNLYVADRQKHRVRKITPAGIISTFAGTGFSGFSGDGGPAGQAKLNDPVGLAFDAAGNLFVSEVGNNRIRKVTPAGIISTVAGDGTLAVLNAPEDLVVDAAGVIYVSEPVSDRERKVVGGDVLPFAGTGTGAFSGDGGPATSAAVWLPGGLVALSDGSVLIADNRNKRLRRVDSTGTINTYGTVLTYWRDVAIRRGRRNLWCDF